ncbi:hypothetical protein MMC09_001099 [Bachmanniomyces sp. S44760]|nr:hypothetical protein [Bachmanniomyces sp. S44760]
MGRSRTLALRIGSMISSHPSEKFNYSVTGVASLTPYTSSSLKLALNIPEPRIRALLIGGGFTADEAEDARRVWLEYSRELMSEQGYHGKDLEEKARTWGTVVYMYRGLVDKVGGMEGVGEWARGELEDFFNKQPL